MYIDSIVLLKQKTTYAYDALGRLTSSQYPNGNSFSYTYDKVGNRTAQNINGTTSTHTNNNDNQLTSDGTLSYTYDNNGNQITRGSNVTLSYDYDSRLTGYNNSSNSKNTQYVYDSKGHRLKEKVNSTDTNQYVNDVSSDLTKVLINKDLQRGVNSYYVYGLGLISEGEVDSPSRQYYLEDGLGNIRFTTDNTGASSQINTYDPYGNRLTGSSTVDFQFKGEQPGIDTNLTFMRARYYDPANGRFISRDPVEGILTNPQSQNGYSYAHNDPVNLSDPSGNSPALIISASAGLFWAGLGVGGALGGAQNYLTNGSSCNINGLLGSMGQGAQTALNSDAGQLAAMIALLGTATPQKNNLNVSGHAVEQMVERGIEEGRITEALSKGIKQLGNQPNTSVFSLGSGNSGTGRGIEVVINDITGKIITVIDKGSNFTVK